MQPDASEGAPVMKAGARAARSADHAGFFSISWNLVSTHGRKSFIGYRALCMEKSGHKRSSSTHATLRKLHQLNDETSLVFTESLRASLCQIAKSARPAAMPIDTSINR